MSKKSWNFFSHLSEIKKVLHETVFRSRRAVSRMQPQEATPVPCFFCKELCQISTYYQLDPNGQLKGWKCVNHAHEVQYIAIPDATYYAFFYTCWRDQHEFSIEAYKLPQGEQWELREGSSQIIHLDFIPKHLTPDNIDRRIHTLLVFS